MKISLIALVFLYFFSSCASAQQPARLIIRGDDMGYSHSGNLAIVKCFKEGIEQSIEVIVPSPWFPEAVKMLSENPSVDVGIHIAITSEWDNVKWRPLTGSSSITDKDGYFFPMVFPNKNYPGLSIKENKFTLGDIEKEWRAQIEMAIKKIPRISHISAHMGCTELNDSTRALIKNLAKEYKIDIDPFAYGAKYVGYTGPSKTSAEKISSIIKMLDQLKPGEVYLFVDHPGLNDAELQAIHHIGYETVAVDRQGVTDAWTSEEVKAAIKKKNIQLISYKDLLKK